MEQDVKRPQCLVPLVAIAPRVANTLVTHMPDPTSRKKLALSGDAEERTLTAFKALLEGGAPIFVWGGKYVLVESDNGIERVVELTPRKLQQLIRQSLELLRAPRRRANTGPAKGTATASAQSTQPPEPIPADLTRIEFTLAQARDLIDRHQKFGRRLRFWFNHPCVAPNGQLLIHPGFYEEHGIYITRQVPDLPQILPPTEEEVLQAVKILQGQLTGIAADSLHGHASKANAMAMMFTPYLLPVIAARCPRFVLFGHNPAAGQLQWADSLSLICCGQPAARLQDQAEPVQSQSVGLLTHRSDRIDSDVWANESSVLYRVDEAGTSTPVVAVAASRCHVVGDSDDTFVQIHCAPKPVTGAITSSNQVKLQVLAQRPVLTAAIVAVLAHWIANGMPGSRFHLAEFDSWAATLGGLLDLIGVPDFLKNKGAGRKHDGREHLALGLLRRIHGYYSEQIGSVLGEYTALEHEYLGADAPITVRAVDLADDIHKVFPDWTLLYRAVLGRFKKEPEDVEGFLVDFLRERADRWIGGYMATILEPKDIGENIKISVWRQ